MQQFIRINESDNVAVALTTLEKDFSLSFEQDDQPVQTLEEIPAGHKVALRDIREGEDISVEDEDNSTVAVFAFYKSLRILYGCDYRRSCQCIMKKWIHKCPFRCLSQSERTTIYYATEDEEGTILKGGLLYIERFTCYYSSDSHKIKGTDRLYHMTVSGEKLCQREERAASICIRPLPIF